MISGSNNTKLRVWDGSTGALLSTHKGLTNWKTGIVLLDGGNKVFSAKWTRHAAIWDRHSGREVQGFSDHYDVIHCCAGFAGGRKLVTGGEDAKAFVYTLPPS